MRYLQTSSAPVRLYDLHRVVKHLAPFESFTISPRPNMPYGPGRGGPSSPRRHADAILRPPTKTAAAVVAAAVKALPCAGEGKGSGERRRRGSAPPPIPRRPDRRSSHTATAAACGRPPSEPPRPARAPPRRSGRTLRSAEPPPKPPQAQMPHPGAGGRAWASGDKRSIARQLPPAPVTPISCGPKARYDEKPGGAARGGAPVQTTPRRN